MPYGRAMNIPGQGFTEFKQASRSKYARAQNMARL